VPTRDRDVLLRAVHLYAWQEQRRPTQHALPYWRLPERLYEDPDELAVWAAHAFTAAERKKFVPKANRKRKRPKK
jgi:TfoX/Sxy family transcriptional regulator of competence genes